MGLRDYHLHTTLCRHASDSTVAYVERAHSVGLEEIGFADHSPAETYFDDWRMLAEELPAYLDMVEQAEARGRELGVIVKLGLEVDYLPGHRGWIEKLAGMAEWDYLIGSVHYLDDSLVVDHPDHLSRLRTLHPDEVWSCYWKLYGEAASTGWFDIMAHPDLPKKFGIIPAGDLARFYEPAIAAIARADAAIEINTGGLRKDVREAYPASAFLQLAKAADIPLTINSDAHQAKEVGFGFDQALALARGVGYTEAASFTRRRRSMVPLPT